MRVRAEPKFGRMNLRVFWSNEGGRRATYDHDGRVHDVRSGETVRSCRTFREQ